MPITFLNREFLDLNNIAFPVLPDLSGNTGDRFRGKWRIIDDITFTSVVGDPTTWWINPGVFDIIQFSSNPLEEGFRINDVVTITSQGVNNWTLTRTIIGINSNSVSLNLAVSTYDPSTDLLVMRADYQDGSGNNQRRGKYEVLPNFIPFNSTSGVNSIIDSEETRYVFDDLTNSVTTATWSGIPAGNQSGMYINEMRLEDITSTVFGTESSNRRAYDLTIEFVISGTYRPDLFNLGDCLNLNVQIRANRTLPEVSNTYTFNVFNACNTGRFDEPFNLGTQNFLLVQGIDELDYSQVGTYPITIQSDSLLTSQVIGHGGIYRSKSDAYHKNRLESQSDLSMLSYTFTAGLGPNTSGTNPDNANYTLDLINVNIIGNELTADVVFTPNTEFTDFMELQDPNDRNMLLWVKINDINILVCDVEAQIVYPEFETLVLDQQDFVDHSQNTQVVLGNSTTYEANTEDDLGFGCYFQLQRLKEYNFITAQIVAYNSSTDDEFVLQGITYNLAGLNFDPNGRLLIPATQVVNPQLPSTSEKVESIFEYHTPLDTVKSYGVYLYYPFLNNWRYWLNQANANVDFFPNDQTRNWVPYDSTGLWGVFVRIGVTNLNFEAFKRVPIEIKDYDSEPNIEQTITLYRESTGQQVNVLIENETNRVVCDHKLIATGYWDQTSVWGMITIEPTESNPRYILSSVIDRVNNANPLSALSGTKITITFPTPDVARLECFVNPNLINLDNGIKFTAKIKGCADNVESLKITTGDVLKSTTDDLFKQKA